ncbi:T9SS-dependent choice-of-anchor J family protein [Epilithonimonas hispanica]|uniref:Por secretion system C-terminal sorting domain-containing protein n=1 Tax=Epilithonimonas hispanica TaxID=358687 RepID=A0A3D9CYB1_9FLAO|nr:choice-of-anchor J domain-containing protein [Epilithonimonas hispanica]REC70760.1 hypothetical protein DRF58_08335 [Epilithonimonas hispanica]
MKKILFSILFASTLSNAQTTVFTESFEEMADFESAGWTLYNDSNIPYGTYAAMLPDAWNLISWTSESGNTVASAPSWFTVVAPADRWMVTPSITLPANSTIALEFFARSSDVSPYDDGVKVKISTTDTEKISFTNILEIDHAVNAPIADQTPYTVDLSDYAGQTIYLSWVNDYTNGNVLSIDDINITATPMLAINDVNKKDLTLYPNPTADYFTINNVKDLVAVKIYDLAGKIVKSNLESVNNKFDVSSLEKGVYTVSIETKSGSISRKIIKK